MEDYVTYEQAVRLKELGFDWKVNRSYSQKIRIEPALSYGTIKELCSKDPKNYNDNRKGANKGIYFYSAPTLAQAAKWLREVKGLFICVWLCAAGYGWEIEKCGNCNGTFVAKHDEESGDDVDSGLFTTYEKALSSGIDEALKLIEKNG